MKGRIFVIAVANLTADEVKMFRRLMTRSWRNNMPTNAGLIIVFSILVLTSGCSLFSSTAGDEIIYAPTEVGTPIGDKVTKDIGPAGGTLSSSDGRLTLTVPQNAVSESVRFSIQPISNNVKDGIGLAYRLEPSGKVFNNRLELSIRYMEQDIEGTFPQALRIAYQNEKGAWHEQSSAKLDTTKQGVTVSTTHLSDWSLYLGRYIKIIPAKADVRVGKSVKITVQTCETIGAWFTEKICEEKGWGPLAWTLKGPGKLTPDWPRIIYTAPARQPKPNVVTVIFDHDKVNIEAKIRIIGDGYRATGQGGGLTYSGVICSLENPFTVYGSAYNYNFKFTPSSESNGTWAVDTSIGVGKINGGGTYSIENLDSDKPRIKIMGDATATVPYASRSGGGTFYIDLARLDTDECGQAPTPVPTAHPQLKGKGPF